MSFSPEGKNAGDDLEHGEIKKEKIVSREAAVASEIEVQERAEQLQESQEVDKQKSQEGLNKAREQLGIDTEDYGVADGSGEEQGVDRLQKIKEDGMAREVEIVASSDATIGRMQAVLDEAVSKTSEANVDIEAQRDQIQKDIIESVVDKIDQFNWKSVEDSEYTAELFQEDMAKIDILMTGYENYPEVIKIIETKQEEVAAKRRIAYNLETQ